MKQGIEFIQGKTKLATKCQNNYMDIILYPDYPNDCNILKLELYMFEGSTDIDSRAPEVKIINLTGSREIDYQGCGHCDLILSIAIQVIIVYFDINVKDALVDRIRVSGNKSSLDNFAYFWKNVGFKVDQSDVDLVKFKTFLSSIVVDRVGYTINGIPKSLSLTNFWLQSEVPELLDYDIRILMKLKLKFYEITDCPSKAYITDQLLLSAEQAKKIGNLLAFGFCFISLLILFIWSKMPMAIFLGIGLIFISYKTSSALASRFLPFLHAYKKTDELKLERQKVIEQVCYRINLLESSTNGLVWRLYPGLSQLDSRLLESKFKKIADASKECPNFMADFSDDYFNFLKIAQEILLVNRSLC